MRGQQQELAKQTMIPAMGSELIKTRVGRVRNWLHNNDDSNVQRTYQNMWWNATGIVSTIMMTATSSELIKTCGGLQQELTAQ